MTIDVNLSSEMETFIKSKITSVAAWQAAIKLGDAELDRGEGIPYTPETLKDITESALGSMHNGHPISPDILP